MSQPAGATAFLALWNSIASATLQREYEAWHTFEHVPERVSLPGFLEARRYRSVDHGNQPPAYFTLYWLQNLQALNHLAYQHVFDAPTAWTARMRGNLTNFLRLPCVLEGAHGLSSASQLAVLHLRPGADGAAAAIERELAQRVRAGDVVCAQWGRYSETSAIPIANRQDAADAPQAGRDLVVLLQDLDMGNLRAVAASLQRALVPVAPAVRAPELFGLLTQVRRDALPGPAGTRPPPRTDLFELFASGDKK
jgi:hypothetical protein